MSEVDWAAQAAKDAAQDKRIARLESASKTNAEWSAKWVMDMAKLQVRIEKVEQYHDRIINVGATLEARVERLEAAMAQAAHQVIEIGKAIVRINENLDEFRAFKDSMAEAANALQAESSPRVPYVVSVTPFEPDRTFDLHEGPR